MSIHIGHIIEQKVKSAGVRPKELYENLNTSRQNLYAIFKRKTIDTDTLLKLSKLLKHNFFKEFFSEEPLKSMVAADEQKQSEAGDKIVAENKALKCELSQKEKHIKILEQTIEAQKKIIMLLEREQTPGNAVKKKK